MKGRKPIPTEVKKLQGTARKHRIRDDEVQPAKIDSLPTPPSWLDQTAKNEWKSLVESLDRMNILSKTDLGLLAIYCNEYSVYIEAEKVLKEKTRVHLLTDDNGRVNGSRVVAYQRIADNAMKKMVQLAAEFGFTPSSRTRIGVNAKKPQSDAIAGMFKLAK